jgi:hypothetical protein
VLIVSRQAKIVCGVTDTHRKERRGRKGKHKATKQQRTQKIHISLGVLGFLAVQLKLITAKVAINEPGSFAVHS